ncbi:hypothetical protein ACLGIH_29775 [Streptomyces sp. HMX87]|uniref:hypothetical protein n=1 Tax=Streptomyces sp. HMX87 TaxID=3390849 RepID=UPI003A8C7E60
MHGGDPRASPHLFFRVDDLDAAVAKVRELGGSVEGIGEEDGQDAGAVTRSGRFTLCRDDQGSRFGLHEPPEGT